MGTNCSICLDSLPSKYFSSLPSVLSRVSRLSCDHRFHLSCLTQKIDSIHRTKPYQSNFSCPLCQRGVYPLPDHSAQQTIHWAKIAQKTIILGAAILGVGIGLSFPIFGIFFTPLLVGSAVLGTRSYLLHFKAPSLWIKKAALAAYNQIYGTKITLPDLYLYESNLIQTASIREVSQYFILNRLRSIFRKMDEWDALQLSEKLWMKPLFVQLKFLRTHLEKGEFFKSFTQQFIQDLLSIYPETYRTLCMLKAHLLEQTGNLKEKEDLKEKVDLFLFSYLVPIYMEDTNRAAYLFAVKTLQSLKEEVLKRKKEDKRKEWIHTLSSLQEESRNSQSLVVQNLQKNMEIPTSLFMLLFNEKLENQALAILKTDYGLDF